ncbi:MAG: tetratricopeptide repeat protein, partial [Cyanobacteria bacterium]|nr:tetratricopeptide repeat protein [Cyanobacteriota bacterium]
TWNNERATFDDLYSRARHLLTRIPYVLFVFSHFLITLSLTFALVTIVGSYCRQFAAFDSLIAVFYASCVLALGRYFWPLLFVTVLATVYLVLILPVVICLLILQKLQLRERFVPAKLQQDLGRFFGGALGALLMVAITEFIKCLPANPADTPPDTIPNGLTPDAYYELGIKYKDVGWPEKSREALHRAIGLDPGGETGTKAQRYLDACLPRYPIKDDAEKRNVEGFNQLMSGDIEGAKKTFQSLIEDYPSFEWPYGNLSSVYIEEKKADSARQLLDKALEINPNYLNGWLQYVDLYELEGNTEEAIKCLTRAEELSPGNESFKLQFEHRRASLGIKNGGSNDETSALADESPGDVAIPLTEPHETRE